MEDKASSHSFILVTSRCLNAHFLGCCRSINTVVAGFSGKVWAVVFSFFVLRSFVALLLFLEALLLLRLFLFAVILAHMHIVDLKRPWYPDNVRLVPFLPSIKPYSLVT